MSDKNPSGTDKQPTDQWLADLYAQDRVEPGAELDSAVLNLAREAHPGAKKGEAAASDQPAGAKPSAASRRWVRAGGGLAAAAVLMLTISIFLRVDESSLAPEADEAAFSDLETAAKQIRAEEAVAAVSRQAPAAPQAAAPDAERSMLAQEAPSSLIAKRVSVDTPAMATFDTSDNTRLEEVVVTGAQQGDAPSWLTSDALAPQITYFYPSMDSRGNPVIVDTYQKDGTRQVHAYSRDRQDVYVEVLLFAEAIDIDALYDQQKRFIEQEDARKQDGQVEDLIDTFLQGRKAKQATITYREGNTTYQRRMYFLNTEVGGATAGLRVVIDPRSQTNHEMIEYMEIN